MMYGYAFNALRFGIDDNTWTNPPIALQIVHPQRDSDAALLLQLPCHAPADADVAKIVDDLAEYGQ